MVSNGITIFWIILSVCIAWVMGLSIMVFRMIRHYNTLTEATSKTGLKEVLETILRTQKGLQGEARDLYTALDELKKDARFHIQRVGLVRFNPFSDTGGSQSFTLTLLDGRNNGLVMTSLYARTGHRWYIKEVVSGKGKDIALSKEEQAAIQQAHE